ncbi:MAG: LytR C-terminal domain-containing protein [Mycobacteriales bacterium]
MSRVGSSSAAPLGARLLGGLLVLAGIALLVVGVLALRRGDQSVPGAAPAPTSTASQAPTTSQPSPAPTTAAATTAPSPAATTVAPPPASGPPPAARVPLTVLNNSTISGLADRAAAAAQRRGWRIAQVGNFAGRLPVTTAYYTPGNGAEERAARLLAAEFPQVGQVLPRYAGLPPTPAGVVLVVTRDWT